MSDIQIAGMTVEQTDKVVKLLQKLLVEANDLHLLLKHVHWNITGPNFIGVHLMIDPQVELVRGYADEIAERMATLGGSPRGVLVGVDQPSWADYKLGRDTVSAHLRALNDVYYAVLTDFREGIEVTEKLDPVTQDMLIGQTAQLEKFQWFIRAHLEDAEGKLVY